MAVVRPTLIRFLAVIALVLAWAPSAAVAQRSRCRVAEVSLAPADAAVQVDTTVRLVPTAYDAQGNVCENITFTWTSSNPAIATVDRTGLARGVATGSVTITARTGVGTSAKVGRTTLTVEGAGGATQEAGATGIPDYRDVPHAAGPGMAAINRQEDGSGPADNLLVEPLTLTLVKGEQKWLTFRANRPDGARAAPVPIVFQVDAGGERVASVDSLGKVTAGTETGTATVRLNVPNQSRLPPRIVRVEVKADTVQFNRRSLVLAPGQVETLSVYVPAQQRALEPRMFQYYSSDTTKLRVLGGHPIVTAVAAGTARIIAVNGILPDFSATVHIHRRVRGITLGATDRRAGADSAYILPIGGTLTLHARAIAADDGGDVPEAPITWRTLDTSVVAMDTAHGTVRGVHMGVAQVDVFTPLGGDSVAAARARIRVIAGGLATTRPRYIGAGINEQLPLEVSLLDDQQRTVGSAHPYLTWTSSNDSVAKVEGTQIVTYRPGHAQLRARTRWDSTLTLDVFVGGDMAAILRRGGRYDLAMVWGGGASILPLTHDSVVEEFPAWSANGTRLAYTTLSTRGRIQTSTLWVMNVDGTEATMLTDDSALVKWPTWVRSNRIVFESNRSGRPQVWIHELTATGSRGASRPITANVAANLSPGVSADGSRIAYVSSRETSPGRSAYGLYTAAMDGSDERLVLTVPGGQAIDQPRFSPDGRTLLFLRREPGRQPSQRVWRTAVVPQAGDSAVAVTPVGVYVQDYSPNPAFDVIALTVLEPAQGNQQPVRRVVMFSGTGTLQPLATAPEDQLLSPAMRPATQPAVAAPHP
jgi:uncharacterized protein YjdB